MAQASSVQQCATAQGLYVTCNSGSQCASYGKTLYGCCPDGQTSCPLATTCVEQVTAPIPTSGPYGVYCTDPAKPFCATFTVQGRGVWRKCATSRINTVVTEAIAILTTAINGASQNTAPASTVQSSAAQTTQLAPTTTNVATSVDSTNTNVRSSSQSIATSLDSSAAASSPSSTAMSSAVASDSSSAASSTVNLPVSASTASAMLGLADSPPNTSPGVIAGIAISGAIFVVGLVFVIWWINRKRSISREREAQSMPIPGTDLPTAVSQNPLGHMSNPNMLVADYARASYRPRTPSHDRPWRDSQQRYQGFEQYQHGQQYQHPDDLHHAQRGSGISTQPLPPPYRSIPHSNHPPL